MLTYLNAMQWKLQRKFWLRMLSAVLVKDTGELMEYQKLTKNPK